MNVGGEGPSGSSLPAGDTMTIQLIDHDARLVETAGERAILRVQDIPQEFLDGLRDCRHASCAAAGETHRVASIPHALVEKWQREGFDVLREPIRAIVRRLKAEGYDHFLTSNKAV